MEFAAKRFSRPALRRCVVGSKRLRLGELVTRDEARHAIKAILQLEEEDLFDPDKVTPLPYTGMGRPCERPGPDVKFVGRATVSGLLLAWRKGDRKCVIFGPKGVGKSTDFRALACILYKRFASSRDDDDTKHRLVFLWAETLLEDEVSAVKNALLFTFLVDAETGYGNWQEVEAAIEKIHSMDDAVTFVERRKQQHPAPEIFYFFVDGGEQLDETDFCGRRVFMSGERSTVANNLDKLLQTGQRVWWCTSPKAQMTAPAPLPPCCITYPERGFNEAEYARYAANGFLAGLQARLSSIKYLTGLVPLFLEALCSCCEEFALNMLKSERRALISELPLWERVEELGTLRATNEQIVELLEEDDHWDAVMKRFSEHNDVKLVRAKADEIQLRIQRRTECCTDVSIAELDPTYAQEGAFCSSYIRRLYMEAVLSKEEEKPSGDGAWLAYARQLLRDEGSINWSTLGWLCEDVLASVIPKKGLILGKFEVSGDIFLRQSKDIPSYSIERLLEMKTNKGYYHKPMDIGCPHLDAVIFWVDEAGNLHIIALQYTVNIDHHLRSAEQFMNLLPLKQWFTDIENYMNTSSNVSTGADATAAVKAVKLHYAYLGCPSQPGYSSGLQAAKLKTRNGTQSGTLEYELHIQPFDESLPGLDPQDYKVLLEIARHRTWKKSYGHVRPEGLGFLALQRPELEKMAKEEYGITDPSRKRYKDKGRLINAMLDILDKNSTSKETAPFTF